MRRPYDTLFTYLVCNHPSLIPIIPLALSALFVAPRML